VGGEGDFLDREGRQVLEGALELLGRLLLAKRMVIFEQAPLVALSHDAAEPVPQLWLAEIPKRVLSRVTEVEWESERQFVGGNAIGPTARIFDIL
jgi:hypothetical protein